MERKDAEVLGRESPTEAPAGGSATTAPEVRSIKSLLQGAARRHDTAFAAVMKYVGMCVKPQYSDVQFALGIFSGTLPSNMRVAPVALRL